MFFALLGGLSTAFAIFPPALGEQTLSDSQVSILVQRLHDVTAHSWEFGTQEQTLIELQTPSFSVLNDTKLPPPHEAPASLDSVIDIIEAIVVNRSKTLESRDYTGPQPFFPDEGSSADPASNGVAALIADWTGKSTPEVDYGQAAKDQMAFLWSLEVPKTPDGAISHRREEAQLWNDFVYMVPPFLAYYGLLTENQTMLWEAYNQVSHYRDYLQDWSMGGLWKHILLGSWKDTGYWATGNGWAAAGMLRVLGTIKNSKYADSMQSEMSDLDNWVTEIHDAMYPYMREDGMFHNYVDNTTEFVDAASAVLLAATVYRQAVITGACGHIKNAEYVRRKFWAPKSGEGNDFADPSSFKDMVHFTADGFVTPVVNPDNFKLQGSKSPEAQAFAIQMYAAWKDWVAHGSPGADDSSPAETRAKRKLHEFAAHKKRIMRVKRSPHS